ncbi:hypothetical protein DZF91_04360 [Actinomadura logoneensis]|uniref:DUF333 domain-containing protein n=1 Tax=Actinomadura logoneensis TaxID=2293572 RepID=A0A372JSC5_9ACTN|nr:hypothetical protein DZF91_04360 [Actinomadura logoneensis]
MAAVAFAGTACGSDGGHAKSGGTSAAPKGAAVAKARGGTAATTPATHPSPTGHGTGGTAPPKLSGVAPQASVKVGRVCSDNGMVARTSDGKAAFCTMRKGEKQPRWVAANGAAPIPTGSVKPGSTCSDVGAVGQTQQGNGLVCVKHGGTRTWTEVKGSVAIPGAIRPGGFCAPLGAKGQTAQGVVYTCTRTAADKQARWRK